MRYLITGSSGFIGRHRVEYLMSLANEVIAVGRSKTSNPLASRNFFVNDIADRDSLLEVIATTKPDRIEHFASQAIVTTSRNDPYATYRTNVLGTVSVLETAKKLNIPVIIFTTDKIYGDIPKAKESDYIRASYGAYETSKAVQDLIAQSYQMQTENVSIVRSCNVFGRNDPNKRIIPNTINALRRNVAPLIYENIKGVRQYIYIQDLMQALDIVWKSAIGIYNVGTDMQLSQKEVVETIVRIWNQKFETSIAPIYTVGTEYNELIEQFLYYDKLKEQGYVPNYDFERGIQEILSGES